MSDKMVPRVVVLMSSYNGEKYIREQIDSILNQNEVDLKLIIRDDGSKDRTVEIINEYVKNDNRVSFLSGPNLGPARSFIDLVINSGDFEYYAFADQDDVWDDCKISKAVEILSKEDCNIPLMYYSNLRIVDQDLNFYRYSHSTPQIPKCKYTAIIDNMATGCTIVFNKKAADIVKSNPPKNCTMHDAWMFLLCSIMGKLVYDPNAYISYRQHSNNVIGTYLGRKKIKNYVARFKRLFNRKLQPRYLNSIEFYSCYKDILNEEDAKKILKLVNYKKSFKNRMSLLFDKDIKANSVSLALRYKILIILGLV